LQGKHEKDFHRSQHSADLAQLHGHAMAAPAARAENAYLSQQDAAARSARVANVDYTLDFTLTGAERFSGSTTLQFDLNDASAPLTIDLDKATVHSVSVNGKVVPTQYNQWFVTLAAADLVAAATPSPSATSACTAPMAKACTAWSTRSTSASTPTRT
jgi:aminopeptidase N